MLVKFQFCRSNNPKKVIFAYNFSLTSHNSLKSRFPRNPLLMDLFATKEICLLNSSLSKKGNFPFERTFNPSQTSLESFSTIIALILFLPNRRNILAKFQVCSSNSSRDPTMSE
ncbi:UNVERIFIED_CONTAM: hypothetical protein NCL1_26371 [Trichonephila clavipes]